MITVLIAGILAAVAYPAFTSFLQRSRRSDAMAVLTMIVQAQERYRSNHSSYASEIGAEGLGIDVSKISKYYTVSVAAVGASPSFASGYLLSAQAKQGSPQAQDLKCFSLGVKLESTVFSYLSSDSGGNDTTNDAGARCWSR
jgi:type IV pilus assembly protein PilE